MTEKVITDQNIDEFSGQLGDKDVYDQVAFIVDFVTESSASGESYRFLEKLQRALSKSQLNDELKPKYQALILKLEFTALPMLELSESQELLQNNFLFGLQNGIDIRDRVRRVFGGADSTGPEDINKKSALTQALETNSEKIGSKSISDWLAEYKKTIGNNTPGTLEVVSFITGDQATNQLDDNSKELLKLTLFFYGWLKYNSIDIAEALGMNRPSSINSFSFPAKSLDIPKPARTFPTVPSPVVNIPAPVIQTPPVQTPAQPHEMTAFEKKLAEISSQQQQHGEALEVLKRKLEETAGLGKTGEVIQEVKKEILEVKKEASAIPSPQEIKREVETQELPAHIEKDLPLPARPAEPQVKPEIMKPVIKFAPAPKLSPPINPKPAVPKPIAEIPKVSITPKILRFVPPMALPSLDQIRTPEDLQKIERGHLQQGEIKNQIELLKSKISELSRTKRILPYRLVNAFEQSPLFKAYQAHGSAKFAGSENGSLSQEEFEAVADLKKELEKL